MRLSLPVLAVLSLTSSLQARGLVIPKDKSIPPLAMLRHEVTVAIEEHAATTRVEQTFQNHTDRQLEASYVFPVPKGGQRSPI
jgi:Ca-activated chloride channel family protein